MDTRTYFLLFTNWALMVLGVTLVDAYVRPLFMGRHPRTQKRYTTFLYIVLITLVFLHSLRARSSLIQQGLWSKETGQTFFKCASVVFIHTFAFSVVSFLFPGTFMTIAPFPQGRLLAINKPLEFWAPKPCLGVSVSEQCGVTLDRRNTPEPSEASSEASSPVLSRSSSAATLVDPKDQETSVATGTNYFQDQQTRFDETYVPPVRPAPPAQTASPTPPMEQVEPLPRGRQPVRTLQPYVYPGFDVSPGVIVD
ncbi:hypothetical protein PG990_013348 [Apiospora arundinis]